MAATIEDPIQGPSRATATQAIAWAERNSAQRIVDARTFFVELERCCGIAGFDFALLAAQWHEETDGGTSPLWRQKLNPAGIGALDGGVYVGKTYDDGAQAAQAQVVHMCAYVLGALPEKLAKYKTRDPRYDAVFKDGRAGTVKRLRDLGKGNWATDPLYAQKIAERANLMFPGLADAAPAEPAAGAGEGNAVAKPTIILIAGHRSDGDAGNPEEKALTPALAHSYQAAFSKAGYTVHYWQNEDGDGRPDQTTGGLDTVSAGVARLAARTPGQLVILDLHYEGSPARGVFAIVPDERGLGTAIAGGTPGDDTWANNPLDVALARAISRGISAATGLPLRVGIREPGVMSETETGVAGSYGARLATMAYTAGVRDRAVRLVVEHGNHTHAADRPIIFQDDFTEKCAAAAVTAVGQVFGVAATPADPKPADPPATPEPPKPVSPFPKGMTEELARRLYGTLHVPWAAEPFTFDLSRSECRAWLAHGAATIPAGGSYVAGDFGTLIDVIRRGDGRRTFKFSNGWLYEQPAKAGDSTL